MADVPVITLDPYLLAVQATLQLLQSLGLIPDLNPLDYIISAFDGKPKLEDTEQAALRLQSSPWWPLRALGNNLQIWVRNGVPLSTGIAADRLELSQWIEGTINSIEPIVFNRFDPYALDHAIWLAMTSQFGDQAMRQLNNEIANQQAKGPLPVVPPPPPQPPPPPPLPGQQSRLDSIDGDELADVGSTLFFQLTEIYNQLLLMGTALTSQQQSDCCTKVIGSINLVTKGLAAIATAIGQGGSSSVSIDLGPLSTAITDAASSLVRELETFKGAMTGGTPTDIQPLVDAVNSTRDVLSMFEKCVCDSLTKDGAATDATD